MLRETHDSVSTSHHSALSPLVNIKSCLPDLVTCHQERPPGPGSSALQTMPSVTASGLPVMLRCEQKENREAEVSRGA